MSTRDASGMRDIESFTEFYKEKEAVTKIQMRMWLWGTGADWESAHSEAWVNFFRKWSDPGFVFEAGPAEYLSTCIRNTALTHLKKYQDGDLPLDPDDLSEAALAVAGLVGILPEPPGAGGVADDDLPRDPATWSRRDLADAVMRLPPQQRAVILLWAWREPPPKDGEIGVELGISPSTVKTHRTSALATLRKRLNAAPDAVEKEESR